MLRLDYYRDYVLPQIAHLLLDFFLFFMYIGYKFVNYFLFN